MVQESERQGRPVKKDAAVSENEVIGSQNAPISLARRMFIRSLAWGSGCGLVLVVALTSVLFYGHRPKTWDPHALRTKHVKAQGLSRLDDNLEAVSSGVDFSADIENTTGADVTLPRTLAVMGRTRESRALHGSFLRLRRDYFLAARHITTVSLEVDDLCAANDPPQSCFDRYFKDDDDIVVFDESHKYELHIPVPTFTPPGNAK